MWLLALLLFAQDPALDMVEGIKRHLLRLTENRPASKPDRERLRRILGVVDPRPDFDPRDFVGGPGPTSPSCHLIALSQPPSTPCDVLSIPLLTQETTYSANPRINKRNNVSHREFVYRAAFPVGRHILGYEIQKVLTAVDRFAAQDNLPVIVTGAGDGRLVALYAAALDPRITEVRLTSLEDRSRLWQEPIDHNVFGLLNGFNDEQVAELIRPRKLVIESLQPAASPGADQARLMGELLDFNDKIVARSEEVRARRFETEGAKLKDVLWNDVLGRLPEDGTPAKVALSGSYRGDGWTGQDVRIEIRRDIFAYGVLLLPADLKPGERRPTVVVQHGLNGRPQHLFLQPEGTREREVYRNFAETLVRAGYVVYAPQNPYIHDFRPIVRIANPLGLSLYSVIMAQYERMLDWLVSLPYVDADRIGYYGLSYGGKTALRGGALFDRFKVVVCGGDFNEWIRKLTSPDTTYSYLWTPEYEMVEWNLAHVASHAEMAMLMAPRGFMVERGHRDAVGVDEWVSYEYAKVRRYYDEHGWRDRTAIAFFNGPHRVDGPDAVAFLNRFLQAPIR